MKRIVVCVVFALVMIGCRGLTFRVPTGGMSPLIKKGDTVLADPSFYKTNKVKRFDIILVKNPDRLPDSNKEAELYVKRVIGLGGEKIQIKSNKLYIDGVEASQPFAVINPEQNIERWDFGPVIVPEGEYFLLGDNRTDSLDSRLWKRSTINDNDIYGKVTRVRDASGSLHDL